MGDLAARKAIESLRSGVPNRHVSEQLGTTQKEVEQTFHQLLRAVKSGEAARPLVVTASFGQGKSHLLNWMRAEATRQDFVTSYVVVSPEAPLGNAHATLKAVAENAEAPNLTGVALRSLSRRLNPSSEPYGRLRAWAQQAEICDRFRALLHIFQAFSADPETQMLVVRDIEGQPVMKTQIRHWLKEINQLAGYDLKHPRNPLLAHERISIYAKFAVACGTSGLVVFFDELERLAKFTRNQRIAAYSEIGWWSKTAESPESFILPVFAANIAQVDEAIRNDRPCIEPESFSLFNRQQTIHTTNEMHYAVTGLQTLKDNIPLRDIQDSERFDIKHRVRDLYERAYGVSTSDAKDSLTKTTIRADIRTWITYWDIDRYYGNQSDNLIVEQLEFDQREIGEEMLPSETEGDDDSTSPLE